jgi:hypothetical protein
MEAKKSLPLVILIVLVFGSLASAWNLFVGGKIVEQKGYQLFESGSRVGMTLEDSKPLNESILFFYGEECPHCKLVEQYFLEKGTEKKVSFSKIETFHNSKNAELLFTLEKFCPQLKPNEIGSVPLLWAKNTCILGDQPIIRYFENTVR